MLKEKSGFQDDCFLYPSNGATVSAGALIGGFPSVIGIGFEHVRAVVQLFSVADN